MDDDSDDARRFRHYRDLISLGLSRHDACTTIAINELADGLYEANLLLRHLAHKLYPGEEWPADITAAVDRIEMSAWRAPRIAAGFHVEPDDGLP